MNRFKHPCLINTDVNARYSWRKMMKNALFVGCIPCLWWCDHTDPQRHHHLGCRRGENRDSKSLILGVDHRTDWLRVDSWGCLVLSTEWFVHHQNQKMILLPAKIRSFIDAGDMEIRRGGSRAWCNHRSSQQGNIQDIVGPSMPSILNCDPPLYQNNIANIPRPIYQIEE